VRGVSGNLVAQALAGNNGDLIAQALVGLEVESELGVVPLNQDLGGLLDGLGAYATHLDGFSCLEIEKGWVVVLLLRNN
jgi:hypothetical protein